MKLKIGVLLWFVLLSASSFILHYGSRSATAAPSLMTQAKQVLAQTSGRIEIDGLEQSVEVIRDRWGVPHIYAHSANDLFLAH
jgi:penicillin amidase